SNNVYWILLLMEKNVAIILSITVAAITVTFLATNGMITATPFAIAQISTAQSADSKVLGHVTYVVRGPDGNIKSYMQTDNIRTTQGLNCAANYLFNNKTTSGSCPAVTGTTGFNWVYLVNNTFSTSLAHTWSSFSSASTSCTAPCLLETANQGLPSAVGTVTFPSNGQAQIVSPQFAFSGDGTGGTTVTGSALFDKNSGTPNEFAENTMSVAVGNADTLTVTWTITLT
ncbi:MAG: hypothetical protein KGI27_13595, partial [Thaumarchaeota archaeon]|nr:hypothetical protein [Nitrososphaerota archaeon]